MNKLGLQDYVVEHVKVSSDEILKSMKGADIFIFASG